MSSFFFFLDVFDVAGYLSEVKVNAPNITCNFTITQEIEKSG